MPQKCSNCRSFRVLTKALFFFNWCALSSRSFAVCFRSEAFLSMSSMIFIWRFVAFVVTLVTFAAILLFWNRFSSNISSMRPVIFEAERIQFFVLILSQTNWYWRPLWYYFLQQRIFLHVPTRGVKHLKRLDIFYLQNSSCGKSKLCLKIHYALQKESGQSDHQIRFAKTWVPQYP